MRSEEGYTKRFADCNLSASSLLMTYNMIKTNEKLLDSGVKLVPNTNKQQKYWFKTINSNTLASVLVTRESLYLFGTIFFYFICTFSLYFWFWLRESFVFVFRLERPSNFNIVCFCVFLRDFSLERWQDIIAVREVHSLLH